MFDWLQRSKIVDLTVLVSSIVPLRRYICLEPPTLTFSVVLLFT